jgi:hypothetical protein
VLILCIIKCDGGNVIEDLGADKDNIKMDRIVKACGLGLFGSGSQTVGGCSKHARGIWAL